MVQFTQLSSHITKTVLMLFWDERDYHITYLTIYLQSFEYLPICNCAKLRDANGAHALLVSRVGITLKMDKKARPNAKYMCIYCINLGKKDGCNIQLM